MIHGNIEVYNFFFFFTEKAIYVTIYRSASSFNSWQQILLDSFFDQIQMLRIILKLFFSL